MYGKTDIFRRVPKSMAALLLGVSFFLSGCGDELSGVLDEKTTAIEAKLILNRASEIRTDADVANPLPLAYRRPPEVLQTSKGWKVFYYARNHSPKTLAALMKGQLTNEVNESDESNQLIISCTDQGSVNQVLAYLESVDVAPIQVKIDCIIIEHYADVTMDRETQIKVNEIVSGGDNHDFVIQGGATRPDPSSATGTSDGWGFFPGASIREEKRADFGMSVGYDSDNLKFLVDMLVSRGYLKVLMNPVVETVTGRPAYIMSKDQVPTIKQVSPGGNKAPYTLTEYIWVEDFLKVTPQVYADGSVSLACEAKLSSKNTPEGVTQLPILTERTINIGENRIMPGKSLVIGGFRKSEKSSVVRGFPFLKDIPIIGILFSSRDFEERAKEVTFILTPSISSNGIPYSDMLEEVSLMQSPPSDPNEKSLFKNILTDPFGKNAYAREMERNKEAETIKKLRLEIETAQTSLEAEDARERLEEYKAKLKSEEQLRAKASSQTSDYQNKIKELEKLSGELQTEIERQKTEYEQTIEKTKQDTSLTITQTEALKKQAEEVRKNLEARQEQLKTIEQQKAEYRKETESLIERQNTLRKQIEEIEQIEKEHAEKLRQHKARKSAPPSDEAKEPYGPVSQPAAQEAQE